MNRVSALVSLNESLRAVIAESSYYGQRTVDLCGPPRRLYSDGAAAPPLLDQYIDAHRVSPVPLPPELLANLPAGDTHMAQSARSVARLHALLLVAEDPQERLVGRGAITLAHQASLVRHVVESPHLTRLLLADEVGLGKTIEAGLIIRSLLDQRPGLRILYLAPARLVRNVHHEFRSKLDLPFRVFSAEDRAQADIASDPLVIASIHRAVHRANRDKLIASDPWDVLVVDECHHVSAAGPNAQHANEHYDLVRQLIARQPADGRVLLMSGTPHQGNRARFDNLIEFLIREGEDRNALKGRVIFRTKEDVRDWEGKPLFPTREVRAPTTVRLGPEYQAWYEGIARLYDDVGGSIARRRASGWAKSQALQWAASSVNAGLGFLARLAIRRLGLGLESEDLRHALSALRPYKGGRPGQRVEDVFARMTLEISRQVVEADLEDMEEVEEEVWKPDAAATRELLRDGTELLKSPVAAAKWHALRTLLDEAPHEKVVMFAQPVETVAALRAFLERTYGVRPALIIGGQSDDERDQEINSFRRPDGPRFLVSSRAGGEGINLQVARRLIHIDVPWNPMELEQRVGRVHRFGSRQTIIVSTLVVQGTREVDAYRVAREKLASAFGDLSHDPERFETLFSRVMALVPPNELEDILGRSAPGPISATDSAQLGRLIDEGLQRWKEFHERFAADQAIQKLDPGTASWDDLATFLIQHADAEPVSGCTVPAFAPVGAEVIVTDTPIDALKVEGRIFACADLKGGLATDASGHPIPLIGTNLPVVAEQLRNVIFPDVPTGAAWLRTSPTLTELVESLGLKLPVSGVVYARQTIRASQGSTMELSTRLVSFLTDLGGGRRELSALDTARLIRAFIGAQRQREPRVDLRWEKIVNELQEQALPSLGRPTDAEMALGIRHAVWPVFTGIVE